VSDTNTRGAESVPIRPQGRDPRRAAPASPFGVLQPPSRKRPHGYCERRKEVGRVDLLWIILIVILVLALLGFFSRGYW
jgi:hypothetical protein